MVIHNSYGDFPSTTGWKTPRFNLMYDKDKIVNYPLVFQLMNWKKNQFIL